MSSEQATTPAPAVEQKQAPATAVRALRPMSKKRKIIGQGLFYAELNNFLQRELGNAGYSGVQVRNTPTRKEIIIKANRAQKVLGEKSRRIRELTGLVQKRFGFPEGSVELFVASVKNQALSAINQAESLRVRLAGGMAVRRACYSVMSYVMESGAKGCEVIISGKLRAARAKAMKFRTGYMVKSGDATNHYVDYAVRHLEMKQGVLGIKVKIMLPYDPTGRMGGVKKNLPDVVVVKEPQFEETLAHMPTTGYHETFDVAARK